MAVQKTNTTTRWCVLLAFLTLTLGCLSSVAASVDAEDRVSSALAHPRLLRHATSRGDDIPLVDRNHTSTITTTVEDQTASLPLSEAAAAPAVQSLQHRRLRSSQPRRRRNSNNIHSRNNSKRHPSNRPRSSNKQSMSYWNGDYNSAESGRSHPRSGSHRSHSSSSSSRSKSKSFSLSKSSKSSSRSKSFIFSFSKSSSRSKSSSSKGKGKGHYHRRRSSSSSSSRSHRRRRSGSSRHHTTHVSGRDSHHSRHNNRSSRHGSSDDHHTPSVRMGTRGILDGPVLVSDSNAYVIDYNGEDPFDQIDNPNNVPGGTRTCMRDPDSIPHLAGRWNDGFPTDTLPTPLCNGLVFIQGNGDICADGRVTYQQILDALDGDVFYVPSSSTVSVQGLMITGQGNVGLGPTWRYFNDFVSSYTIEGVTYNGGPAITDRTFAASMGTIDSFCLDASIRDGPEYFEVSVDRYAPFDLQANAREIEDATAVYITFLSMTVEYHTALREGDFDPNDLILPVEEDLGDGLFDGIATLLEPENPNDLPFPRNIPGAFSALGLLRSFQQPGIYATRNFPNGQYDGDLVYAAMEQIQIDTEWTTFLSMVDEGFFEDNPPPIGLVVAVKHIFANGNSNGCWKEETAGIAMAVPIGSAEDVEDYSTQVYEAIAQRGGTLTLHFGKRMPANREIIRAALSKLESCGVQTNVNPVRCLHPICRRTDRVDNFEWPAEYYAS